jgi:hypothetical protein
VLDHVHVQIKMAVSTAIAVLGTCSCGPVQAGTTAFSCSVSGEQHLGSAEAICLPFRQKIDATLMQPLTKADAFSSGSWGDAINIEVRILKHGSIEAQVTQRKQGTLRIYPVQVIDVMDRPVRLQDIVKLADEVAKLVEKE